MKKMINISRIIEYSKFSAIFILFKPDANAQVIYTDIDPDFIFDESPEGSWLDIDNNGSLDFGLQNYSFTVYSFSLQETYTFKFLQVFRYNSMNGLAGDESNYPFALYGGEIINYELNWQNSLIQLLATNRYHSGIPFDNCSNCNWYNESIIETIDHYLGIRFIDFDSNLHYGWIRCDVIDSGGTLIVKDYAYEVEPDYPIVAGATWHYTDIHDAFSSGSYSIYSWGKNVYIHSTEQTFNEFKIENLTGELILTGIINNQYQIVELNHLPAGVYIVTIHNNFKQYTEKIIL